MGCCLSVRKRRPRPKSGSSDGLDHNTQTLDVSDSNNECAKQEQENEEKPGFEDQSQNVPSSSSGSATYTDENGETVITSIRATDVAAGLRRLPSGFYALVHHSGFEWRTENKRSSVNDDVIEWTGPIPIPSDPSATIYLEVYASFEFLPMLGTGEQLRKLTITVEQLLRHSGLNNPFTLLQMDGDIVSPCSSILVTVEQRRCESGDSLMSMCPALHCSVTKSGGELEDATNQGHGALLRYQKHGEKRELDRSIEEFERALTICPSDHPCRAAAQSNLAMAKFILCQVENTDTLFEAPVTLYRDALAGRPVGHVDRPTTLIQLAMVHLARFEKWRDEVEQVRAETLLNEAMECASEGNHEKRAATFLLQLHAGHTARQAQEDSRSSVEQDFSLGFVGEDLHILSIELLQRFERFGDIADLQWAITVLEELVRSTPVWDDCHCAGLVNLGVALQYRFNHLGTLSDLEQAISRLRGAIDLMPHDHPDKPTCLNNLGSSFLTRFRRLGELSDLEDGILRYMDAVNLDPGTSVYLSNLGNSFSTRFDRFGELGDLEQAISRQRDAVNITPHGHPDMPACLIGLGSSLKTRFLRLGELSDLEQAISVFKDAVDLTPHDHPHKPSRLSSLGSSFKIRFEHLGELHDLEEAISRHRDAVYLTPNGHPDRPACLTNLGNTLLTRFERLGELHDLEHAVLVHRDATDLTPYGHHEKTDRLCNLSNAYHARFERLGELNDLEDAIAILRHAVDLTPHGHSHKHAYLSNLGHCLFTRFERLGELSDVEDAISTLKEAVDLTPHDHADMPSRLNNLGNSLNARFERLQELSDLEDAISSHRRAVDLTPYGHLSKPRRLSNLGNSFLARFEHRGQPSDLEHAISSHKEAVDLTPCSHPHRPGRLINLGYSLLTRFERLGEPSSLEQAISVYSHATSTPIGRISDRFHASLKWVSCARRIHHHSLLSAYSVSINLLPQLAWIGLSLTNRYVELKRGADVVREAAAAALDLGLPEIAVEWLEQGRSIVWGGLLQLRSVHDELSSAHPDHARKLRELSTALEHAGANREKTQSALIEHTESAVHRMTASLGQESDRHRMLAIERDKLLQEIRGFPGFEQFLLCKAFSQLRPSAHSGPVVILNAAESRCDALIILADVDHVIHVPLPNFNFQRSAGLQNMLEKLLGHARDIHYEDRKGDPARRGSISWESLLSTLWNGIVKPVVDALAFSTSGDLSRIFWCPTGPFMFLPIHAAGIYGAMHSEYGHKISDFVVSSYIPTLSILGLSPDPSESASSDLRLLAVRQPPSDGLSQLPGVATELEHIRTIIGDSPSSLTTLLESCEGSVEEVLALMKDADWVHFACHGIQDTVNPIDSGLCLADGRRLKLYDIISLSRPHGGLAFLSACQTATGDGRLSDEAMHITAGMLFAGYGGVVGTMWSISDKVAPRVARDVYSQLFRNSTRPDYREAARALHEAVGRLRDSNASFVEWLPFIHVGL